MKNRTAFLGAILSLIPLGQPLIIKTGLVLSSLAVMVSLPEKVYAGDNSYYFDRAYKKAEKGDHYGAIADYTKAIEINPNYKSAYKNRGIYKETIGDLKGACADWQKASQLGDQDATQWVRNDC